MRKLKTLQAKYMSIIFTALFFVYVLVIGVSIVAFNIKNEEENETVLIEERWHQEALHLISPTNDSIQRHFTKWSNSYPDASMFWVDEQGNLTEQLNVAETLPSEWDASFTVKFIKEHYDQEPFTVIAFLGKEQERGFIVFEIPRELLKSTKGVNSDFLFIIVPVGIFLFLLISYLFFRDIRKRLVHLQDAMELRDIDGLPVKISVSKLDEIGQLEASFNQMVDELKKSRIREQEEEQIRKELIANLSHDLRTPLTKIRAHAFSLNKEDLSQEGKKSVNIIDQSVVNMDRLIENLMSYTLLNAKKLKFEAKETDILRLVRNSMASWYPLFEKENFDINIHLDSFENNTWYIDPLWMERIFDNLFQNVLRHAKDGRYLKVETDPSNHYDALVIEDHGKGMNNDSNEKGAGVGLAIVDLMVKNMGLTWKISTSEKGTVVKIIKEKGQ